MLRLNGLAWLAVLAISACVRDAEPTRASVAFETIAVPLAPRDPSLNRVGSFVYAGGIEIKSAETSGLHGLSDIEIVSNDRVIAINDEGRLVEARLVLDQMGRLTGLADIYAAQMIGPDGRALRGKSRADAEGLAILPNGDRLVSFERDHRIMLYPAAGGPPRTAPKPDAVFSDNLGIEALTAYPFASPTAYLAGGEAGEVWLCDLTTNCQPTALGRTMKPGFQLSAIEAYGSEGAVAMVNRAYEANRGGAQVAVRLVERPAATDGPWVVRDELMLAPPLTSDNFEGVALRQRPDGSLRLYLLTDDNFSAAQHTYLLAFDWNP